jgi:hypothetical protein
LDRRLPTRAASACSDALPESDALPIGNRQSAIGDTAGWATGAKDRFIGSEMRFSGLIDSICRTISKWSLKRRIEPGSFPPEC